MDRAGRNLALIHLRPGQMYIYDASQGAFDPNINNTYTPFTVIFLCAAGRPYDYSTPERKPPLKKGEKRKKPKKPEYTNQFGIWTNVPRGSTVNALGCPTGTKSCVTKRSTNKKSKRESETRQTEGSNSWSNDGGVTWTNDSGSNEGCTQWGGCVRKRNTQTESEFVAKPWLNKNQKQFDNDEGETWTKNENENENDSKNEKSSEKTTKKTTPQKDVQSWTNDGGQTWTNDKESKTLNHLPPPPSLLNQASQVSDAGLFPPPTKRPPSFWVPIIAFFTQNTKKMQK